MLGKRGQEINQNIYQDTDKEINGNRAKISTNVTVGTNHSFKKTVVVHPAKVVVGKEEVEWGQMLRVTLHTTTR